MKSSSTHQAPWLAKLAKLIEQRLGIVVQNPHRIEGLVAAAKERMCALSMSDPNEFVEYLRSHNQELAWIIPQVTNHNTTFFRDRAQLDVLVDWAQGEARGRAICIWSAGTSTGEEAYSLGMLLGGRGIRAQILATDICPASLRSARIGRYSDFALKNAPEHLLARFMVPVRDGFEAGPELRQMVEFRTHNLLSPPCIPPRGEHWDLIICRNVLVYFSESTALRALNNLSQTLSPSGVLMMGGADCLPESPLLESTMVMGRRVLRRRPGARGSRGIITRPVVKSVYLATPASATPRLSLEVLLEARMWPDALLRARSELQLERAENWLTLGNLEMRCDGLEHAVDAFQHAVRLEPLMADAHYFLGVAWERAARHSKARESLRRALFLLPGHWPASLALSGVLEHLGQHERSRRELASALTRLDAQPHMHNVHRCFYPTREDALVRIQGAAPSEESSR